MHRPRLRPLTLVLLAALAALPLAAVHAAARDGLLLRTDGGPGRVQVHRLVNLSDQWVTARIEATTTCPGERRPQIQLRDLVLGPGDSKTLGERQPQVVCDTRFAIVDARYL